MSLVTGRDKKYFQLLGKALNPVPKKSTKEERLRKLNFGAYLKFLEDSRHLMADLKGKLSSNPASAVATIHQKGLQLRLIKYHANDRKS